MSDTTKTHVGLTHQDYDFEKWYKKHYGTDYDGSGSIPHLDTMSQLDRDYGNALLNPYHQKETANQIATDRKNASLAELEKSRVKQRQMADITHEKLKKYLPNYLKSQGMSGLGLSGEYELQAYNNFANTLANIDAKNNEAKVSLENAYNEEINKNNAAYYADAAKASKEVWDNYLTEEKAKVSGADTVLEKMFDNFADENGKISLENFNELQNYVEQNKHTFTEKGYNDLLNYLETYRPNIRSEEEQTAYENKQALNEIDQYESVQIYGGFGKADSGEGDDFVITYGERTGDIFSNMYNVQKGPDADDAMQTTLTNQYISKYGREPTEGTFVWYDGKFYLYILNNNVDAEKWSEVVRDPQEGSKDGKSYAELRKAMGK